MLPEIDKENRIKQFLIVAGFMVLVAFVVGVSFGLSGSSGLEAQIPPPEPTADVSGWVTPTADDPMNNITLSQLFLESSSEPSDASGASGASTAPLYEDLSVHEHCVEATRQCYALPDDVVLTNIIGQIYCETVACTRIPFPVYLYERGTSQIMIDSDGNLHTKGLDNPDPSAFPFFEGAGQ